VASPAPAEFESLIRQIADGHGQRIEAVTAGRVRTFFELLLRWNERINLTGAQSLAVLAEEHFPDSLALARLVPHQAALVDIGSGGGLPALPFAILRPDVPLTLVEPRAKRVAFLGQAVRELGLRASVLPQRLEAVAGQFAVAASRATFAPGEWRQLGQRLVEPGGLLVCFLGEQPDPELVQLAETRIEYRAGGKARTAVAVRCGR
jgi:16S rRNA (guanine527-N7)-methyltransferase